MPGGRKHWLGFSYLLLLSVYFFIMIIDNVTIIAWYTKSSPSYVKDGSINDYSRKKKKWMLTVPWEDRDKWSPQESGSISHILESQFLLERNCFLVPFAKHLGIYSLRP